MYFEKGITSEDIDWCARMLIQCDSIGYNNTEAYVYRQRSESITHTISYKNIYDLSNNVKKCKIWAGNSKRNKSLYELYHDFVAYQYGTLLLSNTLVDGDKDRIKAVMETNERLQLAAYLSCEPKDQTTILCKESRWI